VRPYHHGNLREALIETGVELARSEGPDGVVLREVARRTGVSHNAAYRHFADRDALLEEIASVAADGLEEHMRHRLDDLEEPDSERLARRRGIMLFFGEYLTTKTGASVIRDLRTDLYSSLVFQAPGFFRRHPTGVVMSRLLNDVQRIQRVSTTVLADLVRVGAMAPAMLVLVLVYDWRMTLFALIVLPIMGYPVARLGRRLRKASTRSQEQTAEAANLLKETVGGVNVIQAFSMEKIAVEKFLEALARLFKVDLQAGRAAAASGCSSASSPAGARR